jgi:hypothetical protein
VYCSGVPTIDYDRNLSGKTKRLWFGQASLRRRRRRRRRSGRKKSD